MLAGLAAAAAVALVVWAGRRGRDAAPSRRDRAAVGGVIAADPVTGHSRAAPVATGLARAASAGARSSSRCRSSTACPTEALDSMLRVLDDPLAHVRATTFLPTTTGDRELEQVLAGLEG